MDYDNFLEDGKRYDIYSRISALKIPVKIIHGEKDKTVSIKQSIRLASLIQNSELTVIKGEDHLFENKKEEVYSLIIKSFEGLK